jgi:hypothetical protein
VQRRRIPKGLIRLAGSSLPHHVLVPPAQLKPADSGAFDPKPAPEPPPTPDVRCRHNIPMLEEDSLDPDHRDSLTKIWSYWVPRYVDADENWIATEPGPDRYLRGVVVAGDCPVCCCYCPHELAKPKSQRRMIPEQDRKDPAHGFRRDRNCIRCNPAGCETSKYWNALLADAGLKTMAGDNPHQFLSGGGSKQVEERDAAKNHPARIAKSRAPKGHGTDTYQDETEKVSDLGFVHGSIQDGSGDRTRSVGSATPEQVFSQIRADHQTLKDDDLTKHVSDKAKKKDLVIPICTPRQHASLTSEFRLGRKLKKHESVFCPICKREVFAA